MQRRDWVVLFLTGTLLVVSSVVVWWLARLLTLEQAKTISAIAQSACAVMAVLVGSIWAIWRYALKREAQPKIEFTLELQALGAIAEERLVNVVAVITNRGSVRHYLSDFWFNLHPMREGDPVIIGGPEIDGQVKFGRSERKRYWISPSRKRFFIDPGVTQRYIHVTTIPLAARFVLVYGHFAYPGSEYHSAQQAFDLPAVPPAASLSRLRKHSLLLIALLAPITWRFFSRVPRRAA